jgi:hypothetical protein
VAKLTTGVVDTDGKFATGVLIPAFHLDLQKAPRIFKKIQNYSYVIFRGLGEDS